MHCLPTACHEKKKQKKKHSPSLGTFGVSMSLPRQKYLTDVFATICLDFLSLLLFIIKQCSLYYILEAAGLFCAKYLRLLFHFSVLNLAEISCLAAPEHLNE